MISLIINYGFIKINYRSVNRGICEGNSHNCVSVCSSHVPAMLNVLAEAKTSECSVLAIKF